MKTRTATFALALCLVSSLSFAESAVDAPLVVSDPYATAQSDQSTSVAKRKSDKKRKKRDTSSDDSSSSESEEEIKPKKKKQKI